MSESATALKVEPQVQYQLHAYSSETKFSFKPLPAVLPPETTERYSQDCYIHHRGPDQKIFIFKFGTVVFFNIPERDHLSYLKLIGISTSKQPQIDTGITEDDFVLQVTPGQAQVKFNEITIPAIEIVPIQMVAQILAQSSALELIEQEAQRSIGESEGMTSLLKQTGFLSIRRHKILQFLGQALSARHRIVHQLALLNEPDSTWKKEELYSIYIQLYDNFNIDERITEIEKMLKIASDASALLLEIVNTRRAEIMELIIIALILFEIVQAFFR